MHDVVQAQILRLQEIARGQATRQTTAAEIEEVVEALRAALSGEESGGEEASAEEAPVEEAEAEEEAAEEPVEEPAEEDDEVADEPLDDMTVPELKALAAERGIDIPSNARKDEIIALIEAG